MNPVVFYTSSTFSAVFYIVMIFRMESHATSFAATPEYYSRPVAAVDDNAPRLGTSVALSPA